MSFFSRGESELSVLRAVAGDSAFSPLVVLGEDAESVSKRLICVILIRLDLYCEKYELMSKIANQSQS